MWLRLAALAAFAIAPCVHAQAPSLAVPSETLTLDDAIARVARVHPDLRLFGARTETLLAEREVALQRPAWRAGLDVENLLGSGAARGVDQAEATLTLAGVLERGGKLDARRTLAQSRIDALAMQRETQRLDLLADVARRYLAVTGARVAADVARRDIAQRTRTVAAARQRLQAGASPESVVLTAQAVLARAELALVRAEQQSEAARQHLAALWGERNPQFAVAASDPLVLPAVADMGELAELLQGTPELAQFADERRVREARVRLARTAATLDLDWQVGVRRIQESGDTALVGGISLALGSARRAQPEIRAAESDLAALEIERESRDVALYSTLTDAHGRYRVAQLDVQRTRDDVLPRLLRAEQAAERAYRAGAISYLEWAQLQSETTATRRQQLDAALEAHLALIELQRLTGQALVATSTTPEQGTSP